MFKVGQRIGTIMEADQIIVLDQGDIVGKGTHKQLLETCKTYQEIAYAQLSKDCNGKRNNPNQAWTVKMSKTKSIKKAFKIEYPNLFFIVLFASAVFYFAIITKSDGINKYDIKYGFFACLFNSRGIITVNKTDDIYLNFHF